MKFIVSGFIGVTVYALIVAAFGVAMMGLLCAVAAYWCFNKMDQLHIKWLKDPRNAKTLPTTTERIAKQDCQCYASRY